MRGGCRLGLTDHNDDTATVTSPQVSPHPYHNEAERLSDHVSLVCAVARTCDPLLNRPLDHHNHNDKRPDTNHTHDFGPKARFRHWPERYLQPYGPAERFQEYGL